MWVFTKLGFFSVVQDRDDDARVLVRGRSEHEMLDVYREAQLLDQLAFIEYDHAGDADYPYRVFMWKSTWAQIMDKLVFQIDYDNFKAEMQDIGEDKHKVLTNVWAIVREGWK